MLRPELIYLVGSLHLHGFFCFRFYSLILLFFLLYFMSTILTVFLLEVGHLKLPFKKSLECKEKKEKEKRKGK